MSQMQSTSEIDELKNTQKLSIDCQFARPENLILRKSRCKQITDSSRRTHRMCVKLDVER